MWSTVLLQWTSLEYTSVSSAVSSRAVPGVEGTEAARAQAGGASNKPQEAALVPSIHGREDLQEVADGSAAGGVPAPPQAHSRDLVLDSRIPDERSSQS